MLAAGWEGFRHGVLIAHRRLHGNLCIFVSCVAICLEPASVSGFATHDPSVGPSVAIVGGGCHQQSFLLGRAFAMGF